MSTQKSPSPDSFTFTVGKLDAGMAILLGERAHLIEFPSILLPLGVTTGSIVNIAVHQNHTEEKKRDAEFWELQDDIVREFGQATPEALKLQLRNVTQTSVTLEWPQLKMATAKLRSLDIYKNGNRLASIPSPLTNMSTKLSGLDINTEYSFQLILRTTAGTYPSNILRLRTHAMTDTSGISVCFGNVQDSPLLESAKEALEEMKAKWSDKIQIDTTHFVCTTPAAVPPAAQAAGNATTSPGLEYQRALQLSIPVVQPQWILACHREKKMVPIASYYLGASPSSPMSAHPFSRPQSMSQASLPRVPHSAPATTGGRSNNRASLPAPSRNQHPTQSPPAASFVNQPHTASPETRARTSRIEPTVEEDGETEDATTSDQEQDYELVRRSGEMKRDFKFPATRPSALDAPTTATQPQSLKPVTPSNIEVPPPPPVEKERSLSSVEDVDEEVGPTVDIPLN
ncbi:fibronectin type III/BRCA1 domain containing protein [Amanita muscaria]